MPRVWLSGALPRSSNRHIASVVQTYTGLPLPDAMRAVERARAGEEVVVELDDEYAAYDLAGMLSDLGMRAEVDESL
jgi:hypothetical protein